MSLIAGQIQCQATKSNRMQCTNAAFVSVNGIHYCRLDFNWLVAQQRDGLTFDNLEAQIFPLDPNDQKEVEKIQALGADKIQNKEDKDKKE